MIEKIVFNGLEFASVDAMPPDVRRRYDEAMRLLSENRGAPAEKIVTVRTRIVVNGKEYSSVEELPPALRAVYERATGAMAPLIPSAEPPAEPRGSSSALPRIAIWVVVGLLVVLWFVLRRG